LIKESANRAQMSQNGFQRDFINGKNWQLQAWSIQERYILVHFKVICTWTIF